MAALAAKQDLVPLLEQSLHALYLGTDPTARREADRWLQRLQRGAEGWELSDAILGGRTPLCPAPPNLQAHPLAAQAVQFASMTLHAKVSGDLHELSVDQASQLRGAALAHLDSWSGPGVPPVVAKKLCLAVRGPGGNQTLHGPRGASRHRRGARRGSSEGGAVEDREEELAGRCGRRMVVGAEGAGQ